MGAASEQRFEFTDTRGVHWVAKVSGPVKAGTMKPGQSIDDLPERFILRFRRDNHDWDVLIDAYTGDWTRESIREELEQQPEWEHEEWKEG